MGSDPRRSTPLPGFGDRSCMRVGLFGGSFNPAHEGHRHLTLWALRRLDLDQVWWLVTPQNPLKSTKGMASLPRRLAQAQAIANHPRVVVTDVEQRLGTRYTVDVLRQLRRRYPRMRFVWLMGADNMAQLHRWKRWETLMRLCPVAVFDRFPYAHRALRSRAAQVYGGSFLTPAAAHGLVRRQAPAWTFIPLPRHPASSTAIRAQGAWP